MSVAAVVLVVGVIVVLLITLILSIAWVLTQPPPEVTYNGNSSLLPYIPDTETSSTSGDDPGIDRISDPLKPGVEPSLWIGSVSTGRMIPAQFGYFYERRLSGNDLQSVRPVFTSATVDTNYETELIYAYTPTRGLAGIWVVPPLAANPKWELLLTTGLNEYQHEAIIRSRLEHELVDMFLSANGHLRVVTNNGQVYQVNRDGLGVRPVVAPNQVVSGTFNGRRDIYLLENGTIEDGRGMVIRPTEIRFEPWLIRASQDRVITSFTNNNNQQGLAHVLLDRSEITDLTYTSRLSTFDSNLDGNLAYVVEDDGVVVINNQRIGHRVSTDDHQVLIPIGGRNFYLFDMVKNPGCRVMLGGKGSSISSEFTA